MPILNLKAENDCQQAIKDYLEHNASDLLAEKINNGVKIEKDDKTFINKKTLSQFWAYASKKATEMKTGYVKNETVFGWAIHYFEEAEIEGTLYNEDGTEYKPAPKPIQHVPAPTVPAKPTPPKPQQFTLFDMLTEEKKEEPIVEETPPSEPPKTETIAFLRPTNEPGAFVMESITKDTDDEDVEDEERCFDEEDVDRETGEILCFKTRDPKRGSTLYQKYMQTQNQNPQAVIAYRLGDFFEVFGDNAIKIANRLDLTLTGRDCGLDERVPMVGFPYHASDTYFRKIAEFSSLIVVEDDTATPYILEGKTAIKAPVIEENEPTVYEDTDDNDDFEKERALQQFFDKDALCALYELFDYNLDMQ